MDPEFPFADNPDNPSVPAPAVQANAGPDPGVAAQWSNALSDPTVRSSLLQFGISMLQPPSFGDSFGAQVGRAIGSAGEAQSNREAEDLKRQDVAGKTTLREARASAAEARAREAGSTLDLKRGQLQVQQDRLGLSEMLQGQRRHRDAYNAYNKYVQLLPPDQRFTGKYPSFQEWATKNGYSDIANGPPGINSAATGGVDTEEARRQGAAAVQARPDRADAIRQRFEQLTGQKADF